MNFRRNYNDQSLIVPLCGLCNERTTINELTVATVQREGEEPKVKAVCFDCLGAYSDSEVSKITRTSIVKVRPFPVRETEGGELKERSFGRVHRFNVY